MPTTAVTPLSATTTVKEDNKRDGQTDRDIISMTSTTKLTKNNNKNNNEGPHISVTSTGQKSPKMSIMNLIFLKLHYVRCCRK